LYSVSAWARTCPSRTRAKAAARRNVGKSGKGKTPIFPVGLQILSPLKRSGETPAEDFTAAANLSTSSSAIGSNESGSTVLDFKGGNLFSVKPARTKPRFKEIFPSLFKDSPRICGRSTADAHLLGSFFQRQFTTNRIRTVVAALSGKEA
jgi:hypothetical protein